MDSTQGQYNIYKVPILISEKLIQYPKILERLLYCELEKTHQKWTINTLICCPGQHN